MTEKIYFKLAYDKQKKTNEQINDLIKEVSMRNKILSMMILLKKYTVPI